MNEQLYEILAQAPIAVVLVYLLVTERKYREARDARSDELLTRLTDVIHSLELKITETKNGG